MNSAKLNMVAGAVLSVLLVTMGLGIVSDIIFHAEDPAIPGYEIVVADADSSDAPAKEAPQVEPIAVRLASASAENGEKLTRACAACHDFSQGGANKVGPALWGVLGRAPGAHEGFRYSGAMQEYGQSAGAWDYENLDAFLAAPKTVVSGTSMGYAGMKKPADRADLVAYLRTLAESPMALPEAPAEGAETPAEGAEAPAAEAPATGTETPAANQ
jgi:cytochrome c